ncbi:primosomal protein N' [endosymbiont of Ridgeia piscesae]|jgi:primosomal protein N' (replication factor Y)|uniref:Replication restart protein PriA n=1 Tax=endosymbiont of Ridgeia piscesae TaxID=54398 RepID=A0A0T5YSW4_9GAMM|nr:primosomal protein N' [endosymbiont of Ridgeia piscesae]KRT53711.1 replication restart DNA helicase PriA [endosymbiont of Ridgeia piscesae]KRT57257.1 replication restart DNA helicase PriA [endosymbiont of Ridgeia piscesae]
MQPQRFLRVVLPGPLDQSFDYLPPDPAPFQAQPGVRLLVPFGRQKRCAILLENSSESAVDHSRLKPALQQLDESPLLLEADLKLLRWAASYYQHPLGDVIFHALPSRLRSGRSIQRARPEGWRISALGEQQDPDSLTRAPRQRQLLKLFATHPAGLSREQLKRQFGETLSALRSLQQKAWIEPCTLHSTQPPDTPVSGPTLTSYQQQAVERVSSAFGGFQAFLLDGVTGSGKTEVYLKLIEQLLTGDGQVLVLVPEIGLTPQLTRRFEQRLGCHITRLHSALSEGEREEGWHAARLGESQLIIGTRSAIFVPLPRLRLIIVDEEHDLSLKQQEGFRYSARDLAVVRAQQNNCPLLLGSATPSLESLQNVELGRYQQLSLPTRAGSAQLPEIRLLDTSRIRLEAGLSPQLIEQIAATLEQGNQAMLFLNRRGFAPVITCHACGWISDCPRCDARMTLHKSSNLLWCHHCGHQRRQPAHCPDCGSSELRPLGQGTERIEDLLQRRFPEVALARIDRDSTRRKGSLEHYLKAIRRGDYPLLIGTQMLAKGHHFPNVALVGIIDVDQGLFSADYRAPERTAQLIIQVAGRAGRGDHPGRVLIQTRYPDHPLLQTLVQQGYAAFAREALQERQLAQLPPFSHQALLRAEANQAELPLAFLQRAAELGRQAAQSRGIELWGPVPAPMERRAGRTRAQLLIQAGERRLLQGWLSGWLKQLRDLPEARRVRWSIDVDPQEML